MLPVILVAVGAYLIGDSVLEGGKKLAKGGETDGGKIKFYDVVKSITDLEYDRDPEDLRLHHEERFNWGADNEKDYEKAENEIENLTYSGKGWTVYATTDVSGYNYWMKNQGEQNYISIDVMFDKDTIDESEVENLRKALGNAIDDAENIAYKYDYVPEEDDDDDDYKKGGKMAKGGEVDEDYKEELSDYILKKYDGKIVNNFQFTPPSSAEEGYPFIWISSLDNIDIAAAPFWDGNEGLNIEIYKNEDEPLASKEIKFPLTGDLEKDAEKYLQLLNPYFVKYSKKKEEKLKDGVLNKARIFNNGDKNNPNPSVEFFGTNDKTVRPTWLWISIHKNKKDANKIKQMVINGESWDAVNDELNKMESYGKNKPENYTHSYLRKSDKWNTKMAKGGKLVGKQKNLDVNKNGKLDAEDFKMLRGDKMAKGGNVKGKCYMMGDEEVYVGESSIALEDEVCLFYKKDDSMLKCISKKQFDKFIKDGKLVPKIKK